MSSAVLGVLLIAVLLGAFAVALLYPTLPDLDVLTDYQPKIPLRVVTREGVLIGEFGEERRSVVRIDEVPEILKQAILATEDNRFYSHGGVDYISVVRAIVANITTSSRQGAGTITMQVARNFFLTRERSYLRKLQETLLAWKIEANLSKDEILQLYINQIFLGQRAYGFAAAAKIYFGKNLNELTTAEVAMLAGLPKAPSQYNPLVNPQRARTRQAYVLERMHFFGYINDETYGVAQKEPLILRTQNTSERPLVPLHAEYVAEMARRKAVEAYGQDAYIRGLTVWTTLSSDMQNSAYRALRQGIFDYDYRHGFRGPESRVSLSADAREDDPSWTDTIFLNLANYDNMFPALVLDVSPTEIRVLISDGTITTLSGNSLKFAEKALRANAPANLKITRGSIIRLTKINNIWQITQLPEVEASLIAIDPQTGALLALIGGFDFERNQFNHAVQARRQPGSSFKPFIYSAALEKGFSPGTIINDGPFFIPAEEAGGTAWEPRNYDGNYEGPMRLRTALAKSKNLVTIRVLQAISPQYAQDYITRFGFSAADHPAYLTMALGAGSVTPMQMASAYSVFANGGYRVTPYFIEMITDARGNIIQGRPPSMLDETREQVIDPRNAFIMNTMLSDVITRGTASRARSLRRDDIAGKTGTTNDYIDAWFCGYNNSLVGVVWIGYDQPRSLGKRETGSAAALPIWVDFMKDALKGIPETSLKPPRDVILVPIDPETGMRNESSPEKEWFYSEFGPPDAMEMLAPINTDSLEQIF
ncbi:MAG: penicillin-binding protein 1A [Burkholderiales bacterium]|nr:penicillin-binding protein 1A [Burkholderiales bacterium]